MYRAVRSLIAPHPQGNARAVIKQFWLPIQGRSPKPQDTKYSCSFKAGILLPGL
jgi:hypothetical protein